MLELAVLGLLRTAPLHGYELRQQLKATLGAFRAFSYGSLYPCLRRMRDTGWITEDDGDVVANSPPPKTSRSSARRARAWSTTSRLRTSSR